MYKFNYNYPQIARDSGFILRQFKDGPLDWRLMSSLEVERIMRDQTFEPIESILYYLSEAPLGSMLDSNVLDSGIAKYFILSQFSVQYLLFCRKFLDETVRTIRESLVEAQTDNGKLKKSLTEANNEVLQLHKKITQMESIHEVVFPCHICTKNFLTNDALNIHLNRKHSVKSPCTVGTPPTDRPNDRSLINTIKLELEIKHLKERLNIAEREIREKNLTNSRRSTPRKDENDQKTKQLTRNIGIQNNLQEIKEKDDSRAEESDTTEMQDEAKTSKIMELQEKLEKFEHWQQEQKKDVDQASILEINKKLEEITQSLQLCKDQSTMEALRKVIDEFLFKAEISQENRGIAFGDLEKLLDQKVTEIERISSEKISEVVKNIESKYEEKIAKLEEDIERKEKKVPEITKRNLNRSYSKENVIIEQQMMPVEQNFSISESLPSDSSTEMLRTAKEVHGTEVESRQPSVTQQTVEVEEEIKTDSLSSVENTRIFVKENEPLPRELSMFNTQSATDESTDISGTMSEDEAEEKVKPAKDNFTESRMSKVVKLSRGQARKMANKRLLSLRINPKSARMTSVEMKQASVEISKKRNKLIQTYPNFENTREKLKRYIEKLCSPTRKSELLKMSAAVPQTSSLLKPSPSYKATHEDSPTNSSKVADKPLYNDKFKKRLERILDSPMRQPDGYTTKVVVDVADQLSELDKPVPRPRKRVMFNTQRRVSSDTESDGIGDGF